MTDEKSQLGKDNSDADKDIDFLIVQGYNYKKEIVLKTEAHLVESFERISSSVNRFKSYRICSAFFRCKEVKNPSTIPIGSTDDGEYIQQNTIFAYSFNQ